MDGFRSLVGDTVLMPFLNMSKFSRGCSLLLVLVSSLGWADEVTPAFLPTAFLKTHCMRCHGAESQKADRRFDDLPDRIADLDALERYQDIVDQLNLATMPPEEERQPSSVSRSQMIAQLTAMISEAQAELSDTGGHAVLRRLKVIRDGVE